MGTYDNIILPTKTETVTLFLNATALISFYFITLLNVVGTPTLHCPPFDTNDGSVTPTAAEDSSVIPTAAEKI
jgi:hypothetical protein